MSSPYLTFLLTSADESEPTDAEALGRVPMKYHPSSTKARSAAGAQIVMPR